MIALALVAGSAVAVLAPALGSPRTTTNFQLAPPWVRLSIGPWTGTNLNVTAVCGGCPGELVGGTNVTLRVLVTPQCTVFGCSASVDSVSVGAGFSVGRVEPGLPAPLNRTGTNLSVIVRIPVAAGNLSLSGAVVGPLPPGPAVVENQAWRVLNASNGSGGVIATPPGSVVRVAAGGTWNESLVVNNTSPDFVRMLGVSVDPPFALLYAGPGFPYTIYPGASGQLVLQLRAPGAPGSYNLTGTVTSDVLPWVQISSINVTFDPPGTPLTVSSVQFPTHDLPGEEFRGSLLLTNPTNQSHGVAFNRTLGPFLFVNITPNGTLDVAANSSLRVYLTLSCLSGPGTHALGLQFRVLY